jgi:hypothetical protein
MGMFAARIYGHSTHAPARTKARGFRQILPMPHLSLVERFFWTCVAASANFYAAYLIQFPATTLQRFFRACRFNLSFSAIFNITQCIALSKI